MEQSGGEELAIIAAHIDTAETLETIRVITNILLDTINTQKRLFGQTLYCVYGVRLMEDKILLETMHLRTSPILSL